MDDETASRLAALLANLQSFEYAIETFASFIDERTTWGGRHPHGGVEGELTPSAPPPRSDRPADELLSARARGQLVSRGHQAELFIA